MYRDVQLLECSVVKIEFLSKFFEFLSNNLSTSPTYLTSVSPMIPVCAINTRKVLV